MAKILAKKFFNRPVLKVAPDLLGTYLVRKHGRKTERFLITEVEAYDGGGDMACHASKGMTPRTAIMFGQPGFFYVYFIYGMYWMLNLVVDKDGHPAAVLIRGTREVSGPGRLTRQLNITGSFNKKEIHPKTGLWLEKGEKLEDYKMERTPRIGVAYAGPIWSKKPYRFILVQR